VNRICQTKFDLPNLIATLIWPNWFGIPNHRFGI
jgi:hypothetical protein